MKKYTLVLLMVLLCGLPSGAVLKEKSLARTLGVLKLELRDNWTKQKKLMQRYEVRQRTQHAQLVDYMQRSEQIGLMLYSQKSDFTFDVAYACQQATTLYVQLTKNNMPYDMIRSRMNSEICRYDSLIYALEQMPPAIGKAAIKISKDSLLITQLVDTTDTTTLVTENKKASATDEYNEQKEPFFLSGAQIKDREDCLTYSKALRNNLVRMYNTISADQRYYKEVSTKVGHLHSYAQKKYNDLQKSIFVNGGSNYFSILASLPMYWQLMVMDFQDKYFPIKKTDALYSEWRGPRVLFSSIFMIFYILVGALISNLLLRWIIPFLSRLASRSKRFKAMFPNLDPNFFQSQSFYQKRPALILSLGILIFTFALMIIRNTLESNVVQMATGLMLNIAWLMQVVLISLLIRLKGNQIQAGVSMYTPFIFMAFVVILFRIILIPNNLVNLIFPPILLLCTIWQLKIGKKARKHLPLSDKFYCGISLFVIIASTIIAWYGFTLLSVQITIWWTFQLSAIQTITCIYDILNYYEKKVILQRIQNATVDELEDEELERLLDKGEFIGQTWFFDFVKMALVPVISVISILICILAAADIFEMTSLCRTIFFNDFINEEGVISVSLFKICLVLSNFFIFKYVNYAGRSFYFSYKNSTNTGDVDFNRTLARNIIQILVWGAYFISSLMILKVPRSGIEVITAGLATGMGFAMKDLLENFFYGISLMTGRVRVGDFIECDGILGKVESITYQSTQVVTLDGSIIAFLNSALFNKNFKNLTRNHQYELNKIPVGVAYGTNVEAVRQMIIKGMEPLCVKTEDGRDIVSPEHPIGVLFSNFGDNSVDLIVTVWVLVDQKGPFIAHAKEVIYNVLNENRIEIPFPQRDIHIRQD